jgi:hypothetical protein
MKPRNIYILFAFGTILLTSCGRGKVGPQEYVYYVQDEKNGLLVQGNYSGVRYSLQYQPTDYLVFAEERNFNIPTDEFNQQYNRFKGLEHYNFHIYRKDIDSLISKASGDVKKNKVNYLDFGIRKDIKLVEGNDTLPCSICESESDGGIYPYYSFVIGFPHKEYQGDRQFLFDGKIIGTGAVKLLVTRASIQNIPDLKTM